MTVPGNIDALLLGGQRGYQIERSLRFNNPTDTVSLTRTPASAGNRRTWTWSAWVKRAGEMNGSTSGDYYQMLFTGNTAGSTDATFTAIFLYNNALRVGGYATNWRISNALFRDPSAWYHFVVAVDTTDATANNRVRAYVNGTEITWATINNPTQNADWGINQAAAHSLGGAVSGSGQGLAGYLTEVNFIDGQALTPSSFGETDTITGVWKPKKYAGTYGTNGFYLNFKDNSSVAASTLGKDYSGNGNNWTPSATFSVTAGAGNDSLIDTPTPYADGGNGRGNYATLNPLDSTATLSNGNLTQTATAERSSRSTFQIPSSGLWYAEATATSTTNGSTISCGFGLAAASVSLTANSYNLASAWNLYSSNFAFINRNGTPSSSLGFTLTAGDVVQIAVDPANNRAWIGRNNTWYDSGTGTTGNPGSGTNPTVSSLPAGLFVFANTFNQTWDVNFGQRAFAYTPPSGFKALNTQNLPEPSIKKPNQWMDINLATGNNSTQTITNAGGFQPDLVWMKIRSAIENHILYDSARGTDNFLVPNLTNAAASGGGQGLTAFNSNGFTLGSINPNYSGSPTFVAWQWKKSATPGFDIVTYTGNGTNRTIAHSLGVAPSMMVVKNRSLGTEPWRVYHQNANASPATGVLNLNTTAAFATSSTQWNNTAPTSSVFSVGTDDAVNRNGDNYVAYLWSEVAGFSKFGSYTGNGSTDGPFVFCGFRPKLILWKRSSSTSNWIIWDASRNTYNAANTALFPDTSDAESTNTAYDVDFLSNGFKLRTSNATVNGSGSTYIFAAWAESPAKYSLAR